MLPTPSSTSPNPRPNCTGIAARFHAGSIAVCREGSVVALHFGTPEGEAIITMRLRDFVRGARGPADHHGNPFPTIEQLDDERRAKEETAAPAPELQSAPRGRMGDPVTQEKCERAWQFYMNDQGMTTASAAHKADVPYPTFAEYIRFNHATEAKKIRTDRRVGKRCGYK